MKDYKKYRWFYTSSDKLVVGGKNAEQNDELLKRLKKSDKEYWVMHTSHPGSPFCAIISEKTSKKDLEECATFTGCFSKAWKMRKKKTKVDIFKLSQIFKGKRMKIGTWGVKGKIKTLEVELKLVLVKQKKVYRAVPEKTNKKGLKISPGNVDKKDMIIKLIIELGEVKKDELMSALPAGGIKING